MEEIFSPSKNQSQRIPGVERALAVIQCRDKQSIQLVSVQPFSYFFFNVFKGFVNTHQYVTDSMQHTKPEVFTSGPLQKSQILDLASLILWQKKLSNLFRISHSVSQEGRPVINGRFFLTFCTHEGQKILKYM